MMLELIIVMFFVAITLGIIAAIMFYGALKSSPSYELKRRLRKLALKGDDRMSQDLKLEILHEMTPADKYLYRFPLVSKLDRLIDRAGLKIDVKIFALSVLAIAVSCFGVGLALKRDMVFPFILFFAGGALPFFFLSVKKKRRMTRFTEQFPNTLDMISRSLKVGHSFSSAILMVASEMPEPTASLFKQTYDEQTLGLSLKDSLFQMMERMPSTDLQLFVTTANIHREVGGNISENLERLAATIRERLKIRRQARTYSAQARLSGYILAVIPPLMALFFYLTTPGYMEGLIGSTVGKYALSYAVASQIVGFLVIRKIINIRI